MPTFLLSLPSELLIAIVGYVDSQSALNALTQTCHSLHALFIDTLYVYNLTHHAFSALMHIAETGNEPLLRHFLALDCTLPLQVQVHWRLPLHCLPWQSEHSTTYHGYTPNPLSNAAKRGHAAVTATLLEVGVKPYLIDMEGSYPLVWAAENGHLSVVKLLAESGNVTLNRKGRRLATPLDSAAANGHMDVLRYLHSITDAHGLSAAGQAAQALGHAIEAGRMEPFLFLLDAVGDVNCRLQSGTTTPLTLAAQMEQDDMVEVLLERGADVEGRNYWGDTALLVAANRSHETVLTMLLAAGADTTVVNNIGCTALHFAARKGKETSVRLLLAKGADPNVKESERGRTPGEWALQAGFQGIADMLS